MKTNTVHNECLELLIKRGFYESARFLINEYFSKMFSEQTMQSNVKSTTNYVKTEIDKKIKVAHNIGKDQKIKSAWLWGQSKTHLVFHAKFTYKFDLTGCSDVWNINFGVDEKKFSTVYLTANGIQNSTPMKYSLTIPLSQKALSNGSYYKMNTPGIGSILIYVKKETEGNWPVLQTSQDEDVKKVWWPFEKMFAKDMNEYAISVGYKKETSEPAPAKPQQQQQGGGDAGMQMNPGMKGQFKDTIMKMKKEQEEKKKDPDYERKKAEKKAAKTGKEEDDFDFDDMDFDSMMKEMEGVDFNSMMQQQPMKVEG